MGQRARARAGGTGLARRGARQQRRQGRRLQGAYQVGGEFGWGQGERQDKRNLTHAAL
jgi:hypothetical protein